MTSAHTSESSPRKRQGAGAPAKREAPTVVTSAAAKATRPGEPEPKARREPPASRPPASAEPATAPAARRPPKAKPAASAKAQAPASPAAPASPPTKAKPAAKPKPDPATKSPSSSATLLSDKNGASAKPPAATAEKAPLGGKKGASAKSPAEAATAEKAPRGGKAGAEAHPPAATAEKAPPGGKTEGRPQAEASPKADSAKAGSAVAPAAASPSSTGETRPEAASGRPRRGLGSLGKQAFSRAAPALQLLPRPPRAAPVARAIPWRAEGDFATAKRTESHRIGPAYV